MKTLIFFVLMLPSLLSADELDVVENISGRLNQLMTGPSANYCMDCTEERNRTSRDELVQEMAMTIQVYERCERPVNNLLAPARCQAVQLPSNNACNISVTSTRRSPSAPRFPGTATVHIPGVQRRAMIMDGVVFHDGAAGATKPISLGQYNRWNRQRNNVNFTYRQSPRNDLELDDFSVDLNVRDQGEMRVWHRARCSR
jgi:hypothetical protein